jgi:heptosyltransferase-2
MSTTPEKILVIVPNWLGDVAMCTPALRSLHQTFPDAQIAVVGRAPACALLDGLPWIAHYETIPARPGLLRLLRIGAKLRPHARDLAVVLTHSFRGAFLARLTGARRRLGYARGGRSRLLTDRVEPNRENGNITPTYMTWEYLDLVDTIGCEYDGFGLELAASDRAIAGINEHLVGPGPFVGFAPGAAFGPSKRWLPERYAAVADDLRTRVGAQCVLLTGPGEEDTRDAVQAAAEHPLIVCDEGNPTVDTLKATVSKLDLLVCNDSGPRHVAVAFNVPTICIMGSTAPVYSEGPYEKGSVLRVDVDCGPCQKPICATDHRCMTRINVGEVVDAALAYLKPVV